MIETVLLVITLLYVSQVIIFLVGLDRLKDTQSHTGQPFVSVVIAARNEEHNIVDCLRSLTDQTYPSDRFEVIVANDNSTDGTQLVCTEYARAHPQVSCFETKQDEHLRGKANALAQAIDRARGEIIMITDADCVVPRSWIEETVRRYDPTVGIMGGMTLQFATNHFEGMQSLDWAYLLGIAAASVGLRNPLSTIGNNLSFRKEAYEAVGGYRKIPFSVTEDYTLFQAITRSGRWAYRYPLDPALLVMSKPCPTFVDLRRQKQRWGTGGLDMKLSGFFIMAIGFATHCFIPFVAVTSSFSWASFAALLKLSSDYFFLHNVLSRVGRLDLLKYFYSFQLYYWLYVIVLPFLVFFGGKVIWKGRTY
jgi:cellulose synthase/poly-beta-1,6-N-acetylglucosamine synthase-like glycosyltransferase